MLVLLSTIVFADVVWPALYVAQVLMVSTVFVGFIVEFIVIDYLYDISVERAAGAVISANVFSTFIGLFLIPIFGGMGEYLVRSLSDASSNSYAVYVVLFFLTCIINALLEIPVYKFFFELKVRVKEFFLILLANTASVGFAVAAAMTELGDL